MTGKTIYSENPEDFYCMEVNVPCQNACPAGTNIPAYIRSVFEGQYGESYDINRMSNIFPGVLGRICSRPCEDRCRHGEADLGGPVSICYLKRAAADYKDRKGVSSITAKRPNNKKVAVIGAGPAGLAAARDLAIGGFSVTIFEAFNKPGGMLRYGIPEFRLPRNILDEEIDHIIDLGIEIRTGKRLGTDIAFEALKKNFDAVLVATGCYRPNILEIPGESIPGVHSGLEYMIDFCTVSSKEIGGRVLVIGAGFTAVDCARAALRKGADDVTICLRRTEADLTVTRDEIRETKAEGIRIETLMLSRRITGDNKVEGVEFLRAGLEKVNAEGRRKITPIKGSNFILPADTVIIATGQSPEMIQQLVEREDKNSPTLSGSPYSTGIKGVYVAGDYLTGPSTVIEAIKTGRMAAEKIAEYLTGKRIKEKAVRMEETGITDRKRAWDFLPGQTIPRVMPVEKRFALKNIEVETGLTREAACEESKRCYLCYLHYEIDVDRCIYCRYCMEAAPRDCIKMVDEVRTNRYGAITGFVEASSWGSVNAIVIDNSRCIRCGECMRVCPVDCISVTRMELVERWNDAGE